jgi:hypothetical protein
VSAWASDDLASVLIQPNAEFAGWGQGIIKSWNPDTFENVIVYRGGEHPDIPVASGVEALTYQAGDLVMLSRWQPTGGGATTLRIGAGGRVIVPGSGAASKSVQFMQTNLAKEISAEVFADRITDAGSIFNDASFTAATSPPGGFAAHPTGDPVVISGIEIINKALISISAHIIIVLASGGPASGEVGVRITGPAGPDSAVIEPSIGNWLVFNFSGGSTGSVGSTRTRGRILDPGVYTFETRYRVTTSDSSPFINIVGQNLSVTAL